MTVAYGMNATRANRFFWTVVAPCAAFVGVVFCARTLADVEIDWGHWRQAACMPGACFCETIRAGSVRQMANAWSSLAFVLVSFWVLGVAFVGRIGVARPEVRINAMMQSAVYPTVFAAALFVVGVGSAFYHASLTFAGQFFDVFGMYLIGTFVLIYNVGRLRAMPSVVAVSAYVALNVVLAVVLYAVPEARRYLFAVLVVAALLVEFLVRRRGARRVDSRFLIGAVCALGLAFIVWILDLTKAMCAPESVWQGHAVWHVLGAAACGLVFLFYRSEGSSMIADEQHAD